MEEQIIDILKKHSKISTSVAGLNHTTQAWIDDSYYKLMAADIIELMENNKPKPDFEIHIGRVYDLVKDKFDSEHVRLITKDQFEILELFADQKKDANLNTIYKINDCEFTVRGHINLEDILK